MMPADLAYWMLKQRQRVKDAAARGATNYKHRMEALRAADIAYERRGYTYGGPDGNLHGEHDEDKSLRTFR